MILRLFLFLNSFFICTASAHYLEEKHFAIVSQDSTRVFFLDFDKIIIRNFKNNISDTLRIDPGLNLEINNTKLVFKNKIPYLVSIGSGMVWELMNDSIKRIDNSFGHRMTYRSDVFVKNDTIFKFGGYGFWSARNFFTYFSDTTMEWEFYLIDKNSYLPPGLSHFNSTLVDDSYFVSRGSSIDLHNGTEYVQNNNVWKFDFNKKTWTDLGTSKFISYQDNEFIDIGNGRHLFFGIVDNLKGGGSEMRILDYNANSIEYYDDASSILAVGSGFFARDTIYNFRNNRFIGISLDDFTNKLSSTSSMYVDANTLFKSLTTVVVIIIIILLFGILFLYNKNRKRPRLVESGFRFDRVFYPLSVAEHKVLTMLLYSKNVNSKLLLNELYDSSLSAAQNNRKKLEIIDSLNQKLERVFKTKDFIRSKKSTQDQRVLIYYTNYRKEFIL
jgi:hypothetical protein